MVEVPGRETSRAQKQRMFSMFSTGEREKQGNQFGGRENSEVGNERLVVQAHLVRKPEEYLLDKLS